MANSFSFHELFTTLEMAAFFFFMFIEELFTFYLIRHSNWSIELISWSPVPSFGWVRHLILVGPWMSLVLSSMVFFFRPELFRWNRFLWNVISVIDHGPFRGDLRLLSRRIFVYDNNFLLWLKLFLEDNRILSDGRWSMKCEWLLSKGSEGQCSKR